MKKINTLKFYDDNAEKLIRQYDNATVEQLHKLFQKYINTHDTVLDIGFGSGRDLKVIQSITPNIFGFDACDKFIQNMAKNGLEDRVSKGILPNIDIDVFPIIVEKVDVVISIAVFMHLSILEMELSIENIKKILVNNGIVIISYSLERKIKDERHFEPLNKEIMTKLFKKAGFNVIDGFINEDVMNRDIKWVTQVFKNER